MMRGDQSELRQARLAHAVRSGKPNPNRERYAAIGRELRRVYDSIVNEPVPEEMLALLCEPSEGSSQTARNSEASAS